MGLGSLMSDLWVLKEIEKFEFKWVKSEEVGENKNVPHGYVFC